MKRVMFALFVCLGVVAADGMSFQMDSRGDALVEINEVGGEYKVNCTFSPQTKFEAAINAKFNDAKGDSLCKKGLARYLQIGTNDLLLVSGVYASAPVKNEGEKLCYSFGVPVAGCKVEIGAAKPMPMLVGGNGPSGANGVPLPVMPTLGTAATSQLAMPTLGTAVTSQPAMPTLGTAATSQPAMPTLGTAATSQLAMPTLGMAVTSQPAMPTLGTAVTSQPAMPALGTVATPQLLAPSVKTNVSSQTEMSKDSAIAPSETCEGRK